MPLKLGFVSNFMYPGDGTGTLWQSQVALYNAARGDAGWRYTFSWGDATFTGPSVPNLFQCQDIADQVIAAGVPVVVNLSFAVNEDANGEWEALAGDPSGWAEYLADSSRKYVPPYGADDALIDLCAEIQGDGIQLMVDAAVANGHNPRDLVFIQLPNEMQFDFETVGDNGTYTVPYFVEGLYTRMRARFPQLMIGSTAIGLYYEQSDIETEITNMVAGLTLDWLTILPAANVTFPTGVDFYGLNVYMDVGSYLSAGPRAMVEGLERKLTAALQVLTNEAVAGSSIPFWITEFGASAKDAGLRALGRDSLRLAYLRQGECIAAVFGKLNTYSRFERAFVYASCGDDTAAHRMYGFMVGADANLDGGVDGQWRLNALPLLRVRGYRENTPAAGAASANWIYNPAGTSGTGSDLPAGGS